MDIALVITMIGTAVAIIASNIALISWVRSDMKSFESEMRVDMKSFESEVRSWRDDIQKQMKDFYGRLCSLEARYKEKTDP